MGFILIIESTPNSSRVSDIDDFQVQVKRESKFCGTCVCGGIVEAA